MAKIHNKLPIIPFKVIDSEYPGIKTQFYITPEKEPTLLYELPQGTIIQFNHARSTLEIIKGTSKINIATHYIAYNTIEYIDPYDIDTFDFPNVYQRVNALFCNIMETQGVSQFQFNYNINLYPSETTADESTISLLIGGNYQDKPIK